MLNKLTAPINYRPNEQVTISNEWYSQLNSDTFRTTNSADRSSLLMLDPALRHCFVTAKLIEYKKGNKIREKVLLVKDKVYKNPGFASFEDSSFVFSLYRAASTENKNRLRWVFRTPSIELTIEKSMEPDKKKENSTVL
jgi:hypothetical protein